MIKVEGLTKRYARTVAVDNISFEVEKGGIVGFLGPNGAGKTTTMRVLTCFLPPTSGSSLGRPPLPPPRTPPRVASKTRLRHDGEGSRQRGGPLTSP